MRKREEIERVEELKEGAAAALQAKNNEATASQMMMLSPGMAAGGGMHLGSADLSMQFSSPSTAGIGTALLG